MPEPFRNVRRSTVRPRLFVTGRARRLRAAPVPVDLRVSTMGASSDPRSAVVVADVLRKLVAAALFSLALVVGCAAVGRRLPDDRGGGGRSAGRSCEKKS